VPAPCAICGHPDSEAIVARRATPVLQNAVFADEASARAVARGDLDFRRCLGCGFVWNAAFDAARMDYAPGYENRQSLSPAFAAHLAQRADALLALAERRQGVTAIDVGCGQGDFLAVLAGRAAGAAAPRLFGFDPAWRGEDGAGPAGARIVRGLFDPAAAKALPPADLIVSRHVIEHIADPVAFLESLRACCTPATRLAIETPDVDWILRTGAFHDFFYEHCSLFSLAALDKALARAGFVATRLERVFDQQYLWAEARPAGDGSAETPGAHAQRWTEVLARAAATGPVVIWGAGAKGATFAQMFDADATRVAAVVDVNPAKQGLRLGGSGHRIVAPEALDALKPSTVVVMNPAYEFEIADWLKRRGWQGALLVVR